MRARSASSGDTQKGSHGERSRMMKWARAFLLVSLFASSASNAPARALRWLFWMKDWIGSCRNDGMYFSSRLSLSIRLKSTSRT